ncbi:MAG: XdhC family protein [Solirubrobacterales bacterium]|nr:XdhC family protein [Solirubrobacterales bacterium]
MKGGQEDPIDAAEAWAHGGQRVALATVADVRKSAPRPPGTKMAISESGRIAGAVSGGCVEGAVVEAAEEIMRTGIPRLVHYGITDEEAWDVGLQCGGEIDVWIERFDASGSAGPQSGNGSRAITAEFGELSRTGGRAALVTMMRGPRLGAKMLVRADGTHSGTLGDPAADDLAVSQAGELLHSERSELRNAGELALFIDVTAPPSRLFIFGAVDYAAALCTVARALRWQPFVVDPRARFAQAERFPDAEEVIAAWPEEAFDRLGGIDRATAIVVLTHDPKLDDAALDCALRSDAAYIGAMGSRGAQRARRTRLLERGVEESALLRISAPVGLDIGATTAQETALSIMSEIIAMRRGRRGGRLADSGSRIHVAAPLEPTVT